MLPWHGPRRRPPRVLAFALVVAGFVRSTILIRSGLTAQALAPLTVTDKPGNLAGQNVSSGGTLCIPGEVVALQVTHGDCGPSSDRSDQDIGCQGLPFGPGSGLIATVMFANALLNVIDCVTT